LNYLGDLSPAFAGIARVLRPGGHCALTAELAEEGAIRLCGMRRYQHSRVYIEQTAQSAGPTVRRLDEIVLRYQFSEPVRGWRAVLQRGG
jgi:predicted TPR repeat methyltransferase